MAMTAASQGGVFSPASRVMLYGHACSMVHRVSETVVAGLPSHHNAALARSLGYGRDSRQTAQGGVIPSLQGIEAFCQQRGEDDPSHSRQGCEDLHVMLLSLPRLGLLGRGQAGGQNFEPVVRVLELLAYEANARNQGRDMGTSGFCRSGRDFHRRLAQNAEHMGGIETADAVALQDSGDCYLAHAAGLGGSRRGFPQIEQPFGAEISLELKKGRKIAPKLLAHTIGETIALSTEVFRDAGPLTQFNDDRIGKGEQPEAARVGAQSRGHHLRVTAIVLGTRDRKAIAKPIHLLRVDGVHLETTLDQCLHDRTVRQLDRNVDLTRVAGSAGHLQPSRHLGEPLTSMFEGPLADFASFVIGQEHMMALARPVHTGVPSSLFAHACFPMEVTSYRNLSRSLYWRSESKPLGRRGLPTGHRSRPILRGTCPP